MSLLSHVFDVSTRQRRALPGLRRKGMGAPHRVLTR
ncbi:MAG: hypothetical protein ACI8S6_005260 [Myxococcota bacterium]